MGAPGTRPRSWISPGHDRGSNAPRIGARRGLMAAIPAPQTKQSAVPFYRRPYVGYAFRRFIIFLLTIWVAASLNFFLPRLASGRDPVRTRLGMQAATGGSVTGIQDLVDAYSAKFGLEQPLWKQYINYLKDVATFDFG